MQFNFIHQSRFCSEKLPFSSNGNVSPLIRFMTGLHHRVRHKEAGGGREAGREGGEADAAVFHSFHLKSNSEATAGCR